MISNSKILVKLAYILTVLVIGATGCAKHNIQDAQSQKAATELGLSHADYTRAGELGRSAYKTHSLSNTDLDWTLNLLKEAKNPLVRARAMAILSQVHPMSAEQKLEVSPAITPYLVSTNYLEKSSAQKVNRWL